MSLVQLIHKKRAELKRELVTQQDTLFNNQKLLVKLNTKFKNINSKVDSMLIALDYVKILDGCNKKIVKKLNNLIASLDDDQSKIKSEYQELEKKIKQQQFYLEETKKFQYGLGQILKNLEG